jgi:hypothetical protein
MRRLNLPPLADSGVVVQCWKFDSDVIIEVSLEEVFSYGGSGHILWGFSPISPLHFGYDKIFATLAMLRRDTQRRLTILIADVYSSLSRGLALQQVQLIGEYYMHYIRHIWGLPCRSILASNFIVSTSYQEDLLSLTNRLGINEVRNSWTHIDRATPKVYSLLYPLMQNLDLYYIKPAIVLAEASQMKFYRLFPDVAKRLNRHISMYFVYLTQSHDLRGRPLRESTIRDRLSVHATLEELHCKIRQCASLPGHPNCPFSELVLYSVCPFVKCLIQDDDLSDWIGTRKKLEAGILCLPKDAERIAGHLWKRIEEVGELYDGPEAELTTWIDFSKLRQETLDK